MEAKNEGQLTGLIAFIAHGLEEFLELVFALSLSIMMF